MAFKMKWVNKKLKKIKNLGYVSNEVSVYLAVSHYYTYDNLQHFCGYNLKKCSTQKRTHKIKGYLTFWTNKKMLSTE